MTTLKSIVIALSLIFNDTSLLQGRMQDHKYLGAALVYLITVSIVIGHLNLFPAVIWKKYSTLCFLLEIPFVFLFLQCSLRFVWRYIQDFISRNADNMLANLSEEKYFEGILCFLCCGKDNCSQIFIDMALKFVSFGFMLVICSLFIDG